MSVVDRRNGCQTPVLAAVPSSKVRPSTSGSASRSPKPYLNLGEVAQYLGVSESTFQRIRGEDWMPQPIALAPKILRWSVIELDEALRTRAPRCTSEAEPEALQASRETRRVIVKDGRISKVTTV